MRRLLPLLLLLLLYPSLLLPQPPNGMIRIHYHRFDNRESEAGMWVWDGRSIADPDEPEIFPAGRTDYGVYFDIDPSLYGPDDSTNERIGFLVRLNRDWNQKDGADRFWTPELGREIWLIGNDPRIYTEQPDISPKVVFARIDEPDRITVKLSHEVAPRELGPATVTALSPGGDPTPRELLVLAIETTGGTLDEPTAFVQVRTAQPLDFLETRYQVAFPEYRPAGTTLGNVLFDRDLFHTDLPLGVILGGDSTTFRTFSPLARSLAVVLYDEPTGKAGRREIPMANEGKGVWEVTVPENLEGRHYRLLVETERYGLHEIIDPHATNTTGDDGHPRITDVRSTDPEGFRPLEPPAFGGRPTDAVIWEVHLRDFTIDPDASIPESLRGKYLGAVLPGTTLEGYTDIPTGIDHLKDLGVTHVQILPPQDFDNDEDRPTYNWGYMTAFFNSPEGWFASDIRTEARLREFKQMVQGFHEAGIRVILDVVYNHTGTQNTFEFLAPGYYLRTREDGSFWNGSGTGNEFRSEAPMGRDFIIDSCLYWVEEYGIDGYRFDLMGLVDIETMKQLRAELDRVDPSILLYGEPWAAAPPENTGLGTLTYKDVVSGTGIGAFNDHFRNDLKGAPDGPAPGYVMDGSNREGVMRGIAGAIDDWATNPAESINYATCHDNLTLYDKFIEWNPDLSRDQLVRLQTLTGGILALSQGVLFYHAGVELMRSKGGNHNSYNAGDAVNMIDWSARAEYPEVYTYHRDLIALRRAHPMFRLATAAEVRARLAFHDDGRPHPDTIVYTLDGRDLQGESATDAIVLINPTSRELEFDLPLEGAFTVHVSGLETSLEGLGRASGSLGVPAHGLALLMR